MYFELVVASSMSVPEVGVGCMVFFDLFGFRWCVRARAHVRAYLCMRSVLCVCVCEIGVIWTLSALPGPLLHRKYAIQDS